MSDAFVAVARCRLNFYPGTLNPTPPDYRREVRSDPMSRAAAMSKLAEWDSVVEAPGWEFSIEPADDAAAASAAVPGTRGGRKA